MVVWGIQLLCLSTRLLSVIRPTSWYAWFQLLFPKQRLSLPWLGCQHLQLTCIVIKLFLKPSNFTFHLQDFILPFTIFCWYKFSRSPILSSAMMRILYITKCWVSLLIKAIGNAPRLAPKYVTFLAYYDIKTV